MWFTRNISTGLSGSTPALCSPTALLPYRADGYIHAAQSACSPRLLFSALGASIIFFWSPTSACGFPQQCIPKPQPVLQPAMRRESRSLKTRCWATWYIRRPSSGCSKYRFRGFPGCVYTLKLGEEGYVRQAYFSLYFINPSGRFF